MVEKDRSTGSSLPVTIPDCKTGSVTTIVCESREGEKGKKCGLTSAVTVNTGKAVSQAGRTLILSFPL